MKTAKLFQEFTKQITESLPPSLKVVKEEFQTQLNQALERAVTHFNFVTRQEFEAQCKVLAETQQKLESLKKHLEAILASAPPLITQEKESV